MTHPKFVYIFCRSTLGLSADMGMTVNEPRQHVHTRAIDLPAPGFQDRPALLTNGYTGIPNILHLGDPVAVNYNIYWSYWGRSRTVDEDRSPEYQLSIRALPFRPRRSIGYLGTGVHEQKAKEQLDGELFHVMMLSAGIKLIFFRQKQPGPELITFTSSCMKLSLWTIGKAHEAYVREGVVEFTTRISRYFIVEWRIFPPPKVSGEDLLRKAEARMIMEALDPDDHLVVLDERGKMMSSEDLAAFIQTRANESTKRIVFLIGGAYGIDPELFTRAKLKWSLSSLTFPHQLVRLILAEQLYRSCTILRNEKYHHR
jgi:23S rRNA (pseudouridine1915-N3)-methyltransferase